MISNISLENEPFSHSIEPIILSIVLFFCWLVHHLQSGHGTSFLVADARVLTSVRSGAVALLNLNHFGEVLQLAPSLDQINLTCQVECSLNPMALLQVCVWLGAQGKHLERDGKNWKADWAYLLHPIRFAASLAYAATARSFKCEGGRWRPCWATVCSCVFTKILSKLVGSEVRTSFSHRKASGVVVCCSLMQKMPSTSEKRQLLQHPCWFL